MPTKKTIEKAKKAKRAGKSPSSQAGEFVRAEIEKIRAGKSGARSAKQAIAIGLSEARRAGVDLKPPASGKTSERTRQNAERDYEHGHDGTRPKKVSRKRSEATSAALKREGTEAVSPEALSRQAKSAAKKRSPASRSSAARKAVRTKGKAGRAAAARKAAQTRSRKRTMSSGSPSRKS